MRFIPENGPKMSNEASFDIDQLQEFVVPKSSLLGGGAVPMSDRPMKFKKSLKEQMYNKGFGYLSNWGEIIWSLNRKKIMHKTLGIKKIEN